MGVGVVMLHQEDVGEQTCVPGIAAAQLVDCVGGIIMMSQHLWGAFSACRVTTEEEGKVPLSQ